MTAVLMVASSTFVWNLRVVLFLIALCAVLGPLATAVSRLPRGQRRIVAFALAVLLALATASQGAAFKAVRVRPAEVLMACQDWMWPFCQQ